MSCWSTRSGLFPASALCVTTSLSPSGTPSCPLPQTLPWETTQRMPRQDWLCLSLLRRENSNQTKDKKPTNPAPSVKRLAQGACLRNNGAPESFIPSAAALSLPGARWVVGQQQVSHSPSHLHTSHWVRRVPKYALIWTFFRCGSEELGDSSRYKLVNNLWHLDLQSPLLGHELGLSVVLDLRQVGWSKAGAADTALGLILSMRLGQFDPN